MPKIKQVILFTDSDGHARFREDNLPLDAGSPQVSLSDILPASGLQWRKSPVGFRSDVHVSGDPQWVFVLSGVMEIGLADKSSRRFTAGEHFYSGDILPEGAVFDPDVHGHWSRQVGDVPLVTLFIKTEKH